MDIWGGSLDVEGSVPWEHDTIINVWSTTKTMSCLAALVLASRSQIDLDAPVAKYWPSSRPRVKPGSWFDMSCRIQQDSAPGTSRSRRRTCSPGKE